MHQYYQLFGLIFCIGTVQGCGVSCINSPPIPNSYPGCVCPLKNYPYVFPAGSSAVDLTYQTDGQNIAANVLQNGIIINSCSLSTSCVKRNVKLNENLPYTIVLFRSTNKNKNGAWLNSFQINPRNTEETGETYLNPPELNANTEDQDGFINAGISYNYTLPVDDSIWVDMEFDTNINVTITVSQNDTLVAVFNNSYIYEQVNLTYTSDTYTLSIFSHRNSGIKRMNIESNSDNNQEIDHVSSNDNHTPILISVLVITLINFIIIIVSIIVIVRRIKNGSNSTNYLNM